MCACYIVYVKDKFIIKAFLYFKFSFILYVCVLPTCISTLCVCPAHRDQKKEWVSDPQGLELLQRIVSNPVCSGNYF